MTEEACHDRPFCLGPWTIDPEESTISGRGRLLRVDHKAMHVLSFLADHSGKTVTRSAIFDHVWPQQAVTDDALTVAISTLRRALGDDAKNPRFIRTVPKRGYRLLVERSERAEVRVAPTVSTGGKRRLVVTAMLLALAGAAILYRARAPESVSPRPPIRSIAVLPFQDYSESGSRQYLADAITEELTTRLAKTESLSVTSRTTAKRYEASDQTLAQIGRSLGVDAILEGSVQVSDGQLRVHAQLIDTTTDRHLWAEDYDRRLEDLLQLQSELAATVIGRITDHAVPPGPLEERPEVDPQAYELYLKARYLRDQESPESVSAAEIHLEESLELDPEFAWAHAALAEVLFFQVEIGLLPAASGFSRGLRSAERALELDPDLPEAHAARAIGHFGATWNLAEAGRAFDLALEGGDPSIVTLKWTTRYLVVMGRFEEAVAVARRIEEIDPTSYVNLSTVQALDYAGHHEQALTRLREIESLLPAFPGVHAAYAQIYMHLERRDDAVRALLRVGETVRWPEPQMGALRAMWEAGNPDDAYRYFASENSPLQSPALRARFHALLGQDEEALRLLGEAVALRDMNVLWIGADRSFDRLRSSERFRELVRAVGLSPESFG